MTAPIIPLDATSPIFGGCAMSEGHTTAAVQRYLDDLAGDSPAAPIVRGLLDRAVRRLHFLSASLLFPSYPRSTRPPLKLQVYELLGAGADWLLKALPEARPGEEPPMAAKT